MAAVTGPVADRAHGDLRWHVAAHLLLGMVAPLLLALAAPVTFLLRTLPSPAARGLTRLLRSRVVRLGTHPLVAAVLDVGGLWLVYRTGLLPLSIGGGPVGLASGHSAGPAGAVHLLVHLHMFLAGFLFTVAVVGVDPIPHRPRPPVRAVALVLAGAGHAVLAKSLYGQPPAGVDVEQARQAAVLLYYGGDAVELVLAVLLCRAWFRPPERRARGPRPSAGVPRRWVHLLGQRALGG